MKCLSLRQPYAALIVAGIKTIETRTWKTNYRGKILIHAALKPIELPNRFKSMLKEIEPEVLSATGKIIGSVDVIDCRPLLAKDKKTALVDEIENKYAWLLENPEVFKEFIPLKGKLGLFNVDDF
jgi:ASCH domain-containing protein